LVNAKRSAWEPVDQATPVVGIDQAKEFIGIAVVAPRDPSVPVRFHLPALAEW